MKKATRLITRCLLTMLPFSLTAEAKTDLKKKDEVIMKNYMTLADDAIFSRSLLEINKLCDLSANTKIYFSTLEVRSDRVAWLYKVNAGKDCTFDSGYILANLLDDSNVSIFIDGKKQTLSKYPQSFGQSFVPNPPPKKPSGDSVQSTRIGNYSTARANRFVRRVKSRVVGFIGRCWKHVNDAITGVGGRRMGMYAMEFFRNTSNNTMRKTYGLCKLYRSNGQLETRVGNAPLGSVIGYRPGLNGFHSKWGHGEIKVSSSRYCSDGCANRSSSFRASYILYPCN